MYTKLVLLVLLVLTVAGCGTDAPIKPNITVLCVQPGSPQNSNYFTASTTDDTTYAVTVWYVPGYCETLYPVLVSAESAPIIPYEFRWTLSTNGFEYRPLGVRLVPKQPIRQDNRNLYAFGIRWWWNAETK